MEQKEYELIGCGIHYMILTFDSPMTLTLDFQGQTLK